MKTIKNNCVLILVFFFITINLSVANTTLAPDFKVRDLKGKLISSESIYNNGVNVIFFWHSCCGLNSDQLKTLKELYDEKKDHGFEILGIAIDGNSKAAKVKQAVALHKMNWISIVDNNNALKNKFSPTKVPTMFILKDSQIVKIFNGYEPGDENKLKEIINELL